MRQAKKNKALLVLALIAAVIFPSTPAHACSCMEQDPQTLLDRPDSAFIGVAREIVATPTERFEGSVVVRFDVVQQIKGEVGEQAHLRVKNSSDSCGEPQLIPGTRYSGREALVQVYGGWAAEACVSLDPALVDSVRKGLDPPDQSQPAVAISIGEERGTHIRLLATDGVVTAYVKDKDLDGRTNEQHALCSDGTLASLIAGVDGPQIRVRDLATLDFTDYSAGAGASSSSEIRACVPGQRFLLAHESDLALVGTDGVLQRFDFGHERSGMINSTGTQFGRWREFRFLETIPITNSDLTKLKTIEVRNHTGWGVYPSPDGTRHAVFIWNPIEAELTLMIVPHDGSAPEEIIVDGAFGNPIHWFDDNILIGGAASIDLSATPPVVTSDERLPSRAGPTTNGSTLRYGDQSAAIIDRFSGESISLGRQYFSFEGTLLPLFESTLVTGQGFVPPTRQELPITGEPVPTSLEDLIEIDQDLRTFDVVEQLEEETPGDHETTIVGAQEAPPAAATERPPSSRWLLALAFALLFAAVAVVLRRAN